MTGSSGISKYQQTSQAWKQVSAKNTEDATTTQAASEKSTAKNTSTNTGKTNSALAWTPLSSTSLLIPTQKDGYGTIIGEVELSDKAKDYYDQLKSKFHGMDFILVSKDMKSQVAQNAAAYGNSTKPVVLIDEEKLERMATDEGYRKKYETIISNSLLKLQDAKNSLVSSGANVKNFGMSVAEDGTTSFFATLEKAGKEQTKRLEQKLEAKKEAKAKAKKQAEKKAREEQIEETREKNKAEQIRAEEKRTEEDSDATEEDFWDIEDKEYVEFRADSLEDLVSKVSAYAYENSARSVLAPAETYVGRSFDFKG